MARRGMDDARSHATFASVATMLLTRVMSDALGFSIDASGDPPCLNYR
jgi:hypothetical protein